MVFGVGLAFSTCRISIEHWDLDRRFQPCFYLWGPPGVQKRLVPTLCRADLGWIFYFDPANFRKIAGEFLSEFWWRILIAKFSALFSQGFRPPTKFTPKIHVQNCRHSSPISLSWTQNLFTAIFCLRGRPKKGSILKNSIHGRSLESFHHRPLHGPF